MPKLLLRYSIIALHFIIIQNGIFAQSNTLATKSFVKKNVVLLRWATTDKSVWDLGNKYGYKIERIQLTSVYNPDTSAFRSATLLTPEPLKPVSNKDTTYWRTLIEKNKNAALLYAILYPKVSTKPVKANQQEMADQMLFGLALISCDHSAEIAKAAGLFFKDSAINNNAIYAYRIRLFNPPKNLASKQVLLMVDARQLSQLPKIDSLSGNFKNKRVELRWSVINNKQQFAAYIIERAEDSLNFSPVSKIPYVLAYTQYQKEINYADFSDTVPNFNQAYFYRVRGLSYFGELGPAGNVIRVRAKTILEDFPVIDSANSITKKRSAIYWKMSNSVDKRTLKGFAVSRALKADGHYLIINSTLLAPTATQFIDEKPRHINYYKIAAISVSDDSVFSFPVMVQPEDREPPMIPKGLSGTIDKSGIVKLKWINNTEIDLMGYRIFRSNALDEEFVEVTKKIISDTVFTDTVNINTLARSVYYSVVALDFVYNNSGYSAPFKISRPDKFPPVPGMFNGISFDRRGIIIKWISSSSDDVNKYVLERREQGQTNSARIKEWLYVDTLTFFIDTTGVEGNSYSYTVITSDSSGNISQSISPIIRFEPGIRKKITGLFGTSNRTEQKIELKWNSRPGIQSFILYKAKKGEALRIVKTLSANLNSYTDTQLSINNVYFYAIKAVFVTGAESELSDTIEVLY